MNIEFGKRLREARSFARSLLDEGYLFVFEWTDEKHDSAFIKMKHRYNGNTIKITAQRNQWQARKNNRLIKLEQ